MVISKDSATSKTPRSKFNGTDFYNKYSESLYLKSSKGKKFIMQVLSSAIQFKHDLKDNTSFTLKGVKLDDKEELVIKKGCPEQVIGDFDFTLNRLQGFCAAYACKNADRFDHNTIVAIAASLGYELTPDSTQDFRKFYFSFAPGTENFSCVLEFWPLVSVLVHITIKKRELQVKKSIRKFAVKGDDKMKLLYRIKEKNVHSRIIPVVAERVEGESISFSDCLRSFNLPH